MPVRRGRGMVIAGPQGIVYTPPTGEQRIRSMLDELWSFMRDEARTHPLVRMAAGRQQFEVIHPFADGNRPHRTADQRALPERAEADRPPHPLPQRLHPPEPPRRTAGCSTRPGGAASGSRGPSGCWTACGRPPSGSLAPLERQAAIAERAIARYRDAKPGTTYSARTSAKAGLEMVGGGSASVSSSPLTTSTPTATIGCRRRRPYRPRGPSRRAADVAMVCAFLACFFSGAPPSSSGLLPPHLPHSRGRFGSASA